MLCLSILIAIFLASVLSSASPTIAQNGMNRAELLSGLKLDDSGFLHFADNGVVRSYAGNGTVIDYVPLSNEYLMETAQVNRPFIGNESYQHLLEVWDGVDGNNVKDPKQIFDPPASIRPPPTDFTQPQGQSEAVTPGADDLNVRQLACVGSRCRY
ncbi:hypothetical protein LTR10_014178 [Elasticomyces elasticus]|uniref:Uncharacterized protein n=1 Tax=Exophiala sideris TaxID=1016849 RepID=A0ABR0J345_9EURO|nr:hypothetical protein LTR10_014178 [Elasticomyces elasticus]KAK5026587.1 hypothetical protein LTS07_007521 [Exophiala sideris]KAK5033673.1 hypothetical protein LTR13_006725 [Exophiala sideris]KAK5055496.1 hypothetical protein LTR69_008329 [Exophiala sideris]KAK5180122.1 hypothetical protein LTR44_007598 [Eurotiomycetes sp. CCFEE 6388]